MVQNIFAMTCVNDGFSLATWNMIKAGGPSLFKWFIIHVRVFAIIHLDITLLDVQCC